MRTTWKPHGKHGQLTKRSDLPDSVYAFPKERKEPMTDAKHVRNAIARFDQVTGVPEADRKLAFANIKKAAAHYGVEMSEESVDDLGVHPQRNRAAAAKRGTTTRKRKAAGSKTTTRKVGTRTTSTGARKKSTATRAKTTGARKKTTATRKNTATRKKTSARKKTGARKKSNAL